MRVDLQITVTPLMGRDGVPLVVVEHPYGAMLLFDGFLGKGACMVHLEPEEWRVAMQFLKAIAALRFARKEPRPDDDLTLRGGDGTVLGLQYTN